MKKFWQKYQHETPEAWLVKAIHENYSFSLSVKKIPNQEFVQNFKRKYEVEFMRISSMDPFTEENFREHASPPG